VFRGTVTVVGNEYIQAGEVYYIEDRDLLFYANSVSHSATYNGQYNTTIDLTYGHNPGEYIPTHLDIIGKGLYSNRHQSELVRQVRHGHADGSTPLAIAIRDTSQSPDVLIDGQFADQNVKSLANMVLSTTGLLTPTQFSKELNIELRVYSNSDSLVALPTNDPSNAAMTEFANAVRDWIIDPRKRSVDGEYSLTFSPEIDDGQGALIDGDKVNVVPVDLKPDAADETRSPSAEAWGMARSITATSSDTALNSITALAEEAAQNGEASQAETYTQAATARLAFLETETLVNQILDVWITFTEPTQTAGTTKDQEEPTDQAGQEEQQKAEEAQGNK